MAKKNPKAQRMDPGFEDDMRKIAKIRLDKGLAKFNSRDLGMPEMTKLLRRTSGYRISLEELKNKPKRESIT